MSHDQKSDGGRAATDSAAQTANPYQPALAQGDPNTRRVRIEGFASFMRIEQTPRGRFVRHHYFDLAAQPYGAGNLSGVLAAAELLVCLKTKLQARDHLQPSVRLLLQVLNAAFEAKDDDRSPNDESRCWAALAFLDIMANVLIGASTHPSLDQALQLQLGRAQAESDRWQEYVRTKRDEEAARLAHRRPKRQKHAGQGVSHVDCAAPAGGLQ